MPAFDVLILQQPTKKEMEEGTGQEKILFGPKLVLARDKETAGIAAVTGEDGPKGVDMNRAQVLIRPFA